MSAPAEPVPVVRRFADFGRRAVSALVLAPASVLAVWMGDGPFHALVACVVLVLAWEWTRLCGLRALALPGTVLPASVVLGCLAAAAGFHRGALALLALGAALAWLLRSTGPERRHALFLAAGVVYLGLAGVAMVWLRDAQRWGGDEAGRRDALFLLAVVWASDIGGYAVGRLAGGWRLAPGISPGKTWSGAGGSLALALAAGAAVNLLDGTRPLAALGTAGLLSIVAQAGDLIESAIKRHFHVKDSSHLIPGHGGVLDRLDGLIAAAPMAALLALTLGDGRLP